MFQNLHAVKLQIFTAIAWEMKHGFTSLLSNIAGISDELEKLNKQAAILLHHDAITSTSPTNTLWDYNYKADQVSDGIKSLWAQY